MLKAARLDWEVTTVPLYVKRGRRSVALDGVAIMRADAGHWFGYASALHRLSNLPLVGPICLTYEYSYNMIL